jgi:hypothetical protein
LIYYYYKLYFNFIKGQRLKWFGHVKRKEVTNKTKATMDWQPEGKRPRGRPKKRWIDGIRQDLERLEITNREELVQDRGSWRAFTEVAKILTES